MNIEHQVLGESGKTLSQSRFDTILYICWLLMVTINFRNDLAITGQNKCVWIFTTVYYGTLKITMTVSPAACGGRDSSDVYHHVLAHPMWHLSASLRYFSTCNGTQSSTTAGSSSPLSTTNGR